MGKVIAFLTAAVLIIGLMLGIYWIIWQGWCYVMPSIYPTGPVAFIQPSYWFFVIALFVLTAVGRSIFGGRNDS